MRLLQLGIVCLILFSIVGLSSCGSSDSVSKKAMDFFNKGKSCYLRKELRTASIYFQKAIDEESGFVNGYVMLGKTKYFMGKMGQALEFLKKGLEISKFHTEALYYTARIYVVRRKNNKAMDYLEQILNVDPDNVRANFSLASLYAKKKDYKKAFSHYESALSQESMLARVRYGYAQQLLRAGLKQRAKTVLRPALHYGTYKKLQADIKKMWKNIK